MASTLRYLAVGDEQRAVATWFEHFSPAPVEVAVNGGTLLWFEAFGPVARLPDGRVDPRSSPFVSLVPAKPRRGILWTAGEVHFLSEHARDRFPRFCRARRAFRVWPVQSRLVFDGRPGEWDYFLEGSIRNDSASLFALPAAMAALRGGAYFVANDDSDLQLDVLCRQLALRGVRCEPEDPTSIKRDPSALGRSQAGLASN
jgi:hypothetical protein